KGRARLSPGSAFRFVRSTRRANSCSRRPRRLPDQRKSARGTVMRRWVCLLAAPLAMAAFLFPAPALAAEGLDGAALSLWWALPFLAILLCIATGPLFYPHVWEHH